MSYLFAIISGLLVAFSFPFKLESLEFLNGGIIAWFALIPLFFAIRNEGTRKTFLLTFISSLTWYSISLFWIYNAMHNFGHMTEFASFSVTIFLALVVSVSISIFVTLGRFTAKRIPGGNILWIPLFWTFAELARNYVPAGGFPWANMAMSQWKHLSVIQISSITGVYGVIFLIILVNVYFSETIHNLIYKHKIQRRLTIIMIAIILAVLSFGYSRLNTPFIEENNAILIGAIQPNIPQDIKWKRSKKALAFDIYKTQTQMLADADASIIVWPESSLQLVIPETKIRVNELNNFAPFGSVVVTGLLETSGKTAYNSVFAVDDKGFITGKYKKTHLVPFGEYVPYRNILFFIDKIVEPPEDFIAGKSWEPIFTNSALIGPLVCYEDVFPEVSRKLVKNGAQILINVTNDGWYGLTSAAHQHLALSIFRSVETNRYLVRSANTGVSAIISPRGNIITQTPLFESAVIMGPVFPLNNETFFVKYGNWFPIACGLICIFGFVAIFIRKLFRKNARQTKK